MPIWFRTGILRPATLPIGCARGVPAHPAADRGVRCGGPGPDGLHPVLGAGGPPVRVPLRWALRLLAWSLPGQPDLRGEGAVRENPPCEASGLPGAPDGRPEPLAQPLGPRGLLPPDAGEARGPRGDHRHGPQARADHLPPADHPGALRGEPPRGGRSPTPPTHRNPTPRPGPSARLPARACNRVVSFLKDWTRAIDGSAFWTFIIRYSAVGCQLPRVQDSPS